MSNPENPADEESQVNDAFAVYLRACDSGELTSREEFLKQFPNLSGQLRELMEAADLITGYTQTNSAPEEVETLDMDELGDNEASSDPSVLDPHATLPVAGQSQGQDGPSLPFVMEDYTLLKILGVGGMGIVYLARQRELDRFVAVKMIRSGMLAGSAEVKRFYAEAKAAARLRHPNIVEVYQFGRRAGHHYFSMQYVEGEDLERVLKRGALPPRRAVEIVRDAARAMEHAHRRRVLHRDLKPGNVMIDTNDQIHVTDFGLAKHLGVDSDLTGTGQAVGTPNYMAPEQAAGNSEGATARSDIYSLGAILFAAIAGRPPLVGDTLMQTLMRVAHQPPPPLRSVCPHVDADLEAIVEKCLEKQPEMRYASAGKLADDLDRYLTGKSVHARTRGRIGKVVQWSRQIPVVAALTGHPTTDAPLGQRRVQSVAVVLLTVLPVLLLLGIGWHRHRSAAMPSAVKLAGGLEGGLYTEAAQQIAEAITNQADVPSQVIPSHGTWENRKWLLEGKVHLAPMQPSALGGEQLAVVAPLFYEAVHLLVRQDGPVHSLADLNGHAIAVGPEESGSRRAAEMIFDSLDLDEETCPRVVIDWPRLKDGSSGEGGNTGLPSVAIICIGPGSKLVHDLLDEGNWELLSLTGSVSIALQHPTLTPMTLQRSVYPIPKVRAVDPEIQDSVIETLGTTAFLACRRDASDALVLATLDGLYEPPTLIGLIPASRAAEWQGLAFHRAARKYYDTLAD